MNEAVFISDLHLHPDQPAIMKKFRQFVLWAPNHTRSIYILGDFLHVWAGDDASNAWSDEITELLAGLADQGIRLFFLEGNRDFLIGEQFLDKAKMQRLVDPTVIRFGEENVLLSHGDRYCTQDYSHFYFQFLTRNRWFRFLFLRLPYALRQSLVNRVRDYSQQNTRKTYESMQTMPAAMQKELRRYAAARLIHGHTHQPGVRTHLKSEGYWQEYTLSDWDENPSVLCYNDTIYQFYHFQ